ncbi:hypothetical protein U9M48_013734 [Paspalum notatum var. saurae]|uniref:Uncharacterized protein n=1 Tax=Paspalum notatum var. saurae TaxID=547442 RepID=A0AAQ3T0I6_PASNO
MPLADASGARRRRSQAAAARGFAVCAAPERSAPPLSLPLLPPPRVPPVAAVEDLSTSPPRPPHPPTHAARACAPHPHARRGSEPWRGRLHSPTRWRRQTPPAGCPFRATARHQRDLPACLCFSGAGRRPQGHLREGRRARIPRLFSIPMRDPEPSSTSGLMYAFKAAWTFARSQPDVSGIDAQWRIGRPATRLCILQHRRPQVCCHDKETSMAICA